MKPSGETSLRPANTSSSIVPTCNKEENGDSANPFSSIKENRKISVIIPAYNAGKTLENAIKSVLQQDFLKEVIVIDNNSTDNTRMIARSFPAITLLAEPVPGAGAARNRGLKTASGEFIAFVDADVILPSQWTSRALHKLNHRHMAAVGGPCISPGTDMVSRSLNALLYGRKKTDTDLITSHVASMASLYRREEIGHVTFNESLLREQDFEFNLRLGNHGFRFLNSPELEVLHIHPTTLWKLMKKWYSNGVYYPMPYLMHPRHMGIGFIFRHLFLLVMTGALMGSVFFYPLILIPFLQVVLMQSIYFFLIWRNRPKAGLFFLIRSSFIHCMKQLAQLAGILMGYVKRGKNWSSIK